MYKAKTLTIEPYPKYLLMSSTELSVLPQNIQTRELLSHVKEQETSEYNQ